MSEEWKKYIEDPRKVCKYSTKCYQKNPEHHNTYKHPPHRNKRKKNVSPTANKRQKTEIDNIQQSTSNTECKDIKDAKEKSESNSVDLKIDEAIDNSIKDDMEITVPKQITYYDATDSSELISDLFLVNMPQDFYKFYECIKEEGSTALDMLAGVNLKLVGPFELMMGNLPQVEDKDRYLVHWRFYFDPPEFQCVLKKKGKSEYHIGYFRDSPNDMPIFLASNDSAKDCVMTPIATNIFGAVFSYLQSEKKRSPFTAMGYQKVIDKVKVWAEKYSYSLEPFDMKKRLQKVVTRSLHGAGIVVPYNKKNQLGYRPLVENDATLKKIFNKLVKAATPEEKSTALSELQPVITYASIAVDECDFGTGLEMGLDLFASGIKDLQQSAGSLLSSTYPLLKRDAFSTIIQTHLKYRRKGPEMSLLNI